MPCKVRKDGVLMKGLLDDHELDMQCSYLKILTMVSNNEAITNFYFFMNPIIWLWAKFNFGSIFKHKCLKFIKLVEIACVQVLGFVEDEFYFSMVARSWKISWGTTSCAIWICAFDFMHHNWQFSFWRCHHPMEKHEGMILLWWVKANGLLKFEKDS